MKKSVLLGATALLSFGAQAQTVDYGTLQDAFGQAVTTGATGKPQVQSDAPAAMRIISAADIKATGLDNLPDILGRVAGVDILRWGRASVDVGMRGYNQSANPRLLVLLNGRQVYGDHYALVNWSSIPVQLSEIRQIEVVKGPVGAIYGFNAVSGVINIITYNPLYDNAGTATARIGNHGQREIGLSKALKLSDKVGARLSAGYKEADEFERGSLTAVEKAGKNDPESTNVNAAILAQVTDSVQAGVEVTHSDVHQYELTSSLTYGYNKFKTTSAKADVSADAGALGLINLTAYRNWLDLNYSGTAIGDVVTTVVQLSDLIQVNADNTVKLTGEFRHNEMDQLLLGTGRIGYDVWAGSAMWDWKISDQVTFTNSARIDLFSLQNDGLKIAPYKAEDFNRDMTKISVNSGVVFKPTDTDTFRATYGIANQLPSLIELGGLFRQTSAVSYLVGNPNILPSKITGMELGYSRTITAINGHTNINVFHQKTKNVKSFIGSDLTKVNSGFAMSPINAGDSKNWGTEIEVAGATAGGVSYELSYTWTDINDDLTVNKGAIPTRPVNFEAAAPKHKLRGTLGYTMGALTAQANVSYQSERSLLRAPSSFAPLSLVHIDSYWSAGGTLAYLFESGTEIRLTGSDMLRADTLTVPGLRTDRRVYASVSQKF